MQPTTHLHVCLPPQVSPRTRWLVAHDWVRASVFGRNLSDI